MNLSTSVGEPASQGQKAAPAAGGHQALKALLHLQLCRPRDTRREGVAPLGRGVSQRRAETLAQRTHGWAEQIGLLGRKMVSPKATLELPASVTSNKKRAVPK